MPLTDALILTAICVAFVGFGVLLAWGERQTRHLSQTGRQNFAKGGAQAPRQIVSVASNSREREMAKH